jgi:DNA-binding CsgD family transcriptional regulator
MKQGYEALTEKEKQTLRLLLAGHDAKSMARDLGLSVHTVNERLRDARRKLSATSSKEAARLVREAETPPEPLVDKSFGDAGSAPAGQSLGQPEAASSSKHYALWAIGGLAMISLAVALLALTPSPQQSGGGAPPSNAASAAPLPAQSAALDVARQWLALVDAGKWQESWAATTTSFRSANTVEAWQSASEGGRVPLGRVLSRSVGTNEGIPAPPSGYQLVRFRTDFANKAGATETLTLAPEGGTWKIVGYYIE